MRVFKKLLPLFLILLTSTVFAQEEILSIKQSKGLNSKISSYDLPPDEATVAENIRFDRVGSLLKREGRNKYNTTSIGDNPIYFMDRVYINDDKYLFIGYDTTPTATLKVGTDSTGTFADVQTGLTTGAAITGETYKNHYYLGNGEEDNIRFTGSVPTTMGCQIPSTAMSGAKANFGSGLDEDAIYQYKVAFMYDDYQLSEGNATALSVTPTSGLLGVGLASIPTGSATSGVTDRNLYRTEGGGAVFYYLNQLADNTTIVYSDSCPDSSLGATILPTDHEVPEICKYFKLHEDRIFISGNSTYESRVWFSDIDGGVSYPDIFPTANYVNIAADDGDIIMGLEKDPMGMICVFKKNTIYKILTEGSPKEWEVRGPFDFHGAIASQSIQRTPDGIIYLSRRGPGRKELRLFNGQTSQNISDRIEPTLANISDSYINNCRSAYHEGKYYLAYTDRTAAESQNTKVLVLDLERDAFAIDNMNVGSFCIWNGSDDWGELYSGDSKLGFVYHEAIEETDIIHRLKSELDTGDFDNCESGGSELAPTVTLIATDLANAVGAKTISDLTASTEEIQDYTGEDDTISPSGDLKSEVLSVDAKNFVAGLWTEELGDNGDITLQVRAGASSVACAAATWSSKYTAPGGSDISTETAGNYVQYQIRLYTDDIETVSTPKLYRTEQDYAVKVSFGYGAPSETTIDFAYETGDLDCGRSDLTKRFRSIRTKYKGEDTGTFNIYYFLDGAEDSDGSFEIDMATKNDSYVGYFPLTAYGENIRFRINESSTKNFEFKGLEAIFSLEPRRW